MFGPKTYTGLLGAVAVVTFSVICMCSWLLGQWAPSLKDAGGPPVGMGFVKLDVPAYWLLAAIVSGFVFRLIKLHDRVSDIFGIRKHYDFDYIIIPLFRGSKGPNVPTPNLQLFHERRRQIMRAIFYQYTNGGSPNSIPSHFTDMVWESLWLFWSLVEAMVVVIAFTLLSLIFLEFEAALYFALFAGALLAIIPVAHLFCVRQTTAEVDEILSSPARRAEISTAFDEILH
jgi:hypothetical protein